MAVVNASYPPNTPRKRVGKRLLPDAVFQPQGGWFYRLSLDSKIIFLTLSVRLFQVVFIVSLHGPHCADLVVWVVTHSELKNGHISEKNLVINMALFQLCI